MFWLHLGAGGPKPPDLAGGMMNYGASFLRSPTKGIWVAGLLCVFCPAIAAEAQVVSVCDISTQMDRIAQPEDLNIRHYANGHVMVAVVDDGRADAAQALSILVISPPLDHTGQRQCRLVSMTPAKGYAALVLDRAGAVYDPATGLTVTFPALIMPSADSPGDKIDVAVTINQATGNITPLHSAPNP